MYSNLIPAVDWFFVYKKAMTSNDLVVCPVPAFAIDKDGNVIGLIPVEQSGGKPPRLASPPPYINGAYVHRDQLTENEAKLARTTR